MTLGSNTLTDDATVCCSEFFGTIQGTGGLNVTGPGGLILQGSNTYTGGTSIAAGSTLEIGLGGTTGSIVGNIVDNGLLISARHDNVTFGGIISGSGALQLGSTGFASGTVILTGANTYTGATTITEGALQVGAGGTVGSIASPTVSVASGAALAFDRSDTLTYAGSISGAGALTQAGTGTLIP